MFWIKPEQLQDGKPKVIDIVSQIQEDELLQIAGSLEQNSEHPLAEAILEKAKEKKIPLKKVEDFKTISGRGIQGTMNEEKYFCGNLAFMQENNISVQEVEKQVQEFLEQGKTVLYFAKENTLIGAISVADTIKESSFEAIEKRKARSGHVNRR